MSTRLDQLFIERAELEAERARFISERATVLRRIEHMRSQVDEGRDGVSSLIESPRFDQLSRIITEINAEVAGINRDIEAERSKSEPAASERHDVRLEVLLRRQDDARLQREEMVGARADIQRLADEAGQSDLDEAQDTRFRALTREIALLDEETQERDQEIDVLAALDARVIETI